MAYFINYCKFNEIRKYNHKHSNVSQHTENGTIFNGSMRIYWYLAREMVTSKLMRGIDWIQHHDVIVYKNLVFIGPHIYSKTAFIKLSALDSVFERCVFGDHFHRTEYKWVVGQAGEKKSLFSNKNGFVWTGSY